MQKFPMRLEVSAVAAQARAAPGVNVDQPAQKALAKGRKGGTEPRGPPQLQGVRGVVARIAPSQLRIVTIRHGLKVSVLILPCFGHFG